MKTRGRRRRVDVHAGAGRRPRPDAGRAAGRRAGPGRPGRRTGSRSSAAFGRRILARHGPPGAAHHDRRPRAGAGRRRRRAPAAAGRRAGGAQPGRDLAAGVRLRRAGDDRRRAVSPRPCARCRSSSTSPSGSRQASPDAWIVDFTNPVGIVTRALLQAGSPGGRAVQRGDRLPAPLRRPARRRAGAGAARPRGAQPPDLGTRACSWTASTGCPSCSAEHVERDRRRHRAAGRAARAARRWCRRTTCATSTPTTRWSASCVPPSARAAGGGDRAASCSRMYARPAARHEARAADAARRRLLLGGRRRSSAAALLGRGDADDDPGGQRAQRRHPAVPARRRRHRGPGARRRRAVHAAAGRAARTAVRRAGLRTSRPTSTWRSRPRCTAARTASSRRCSRTRWSVRSTSPRALTDRLIAHNRDYLPWA